MSYVYFNPGHVIGICYAASEKADAIRMALQQEYAYVLEEKTPGCVVFWVSNYEIELCPTRGARLVGSSNVQIIPLHG